MKQFACTITTHAGIHGRNAGLIARLAKSFSDTAVTICCDGREANGTLRHKLMSLGAKMGSRVTIVTDGADEDAAIIALSDFFQNNL